MSQNTFWVLGLLIIGYINCAGSSTEDNEIEELGETSRLNNPIPDVIKAGINVNLLVDAILVATRKAIEVAGADQVQLDPVDTDFDVSLKIATLKAHVALTNGTLQALNSIERRGDARIIPRIFHREVDVVATLGLKTAVAEYYYYLQILGIHPNGNLTAVVGDNAVAVKFALSIDSQGCHIKLVDLKMTRCADVNVTLTGLYPFDTWSSRLATQMIEPLEAQLAQKIETTLRFFIEQELHKVGVPCAKN